MSQEITKLMAKLFPKCPICRSEEGYEPSTFYPDVRCRSCEAEWTLFENGMELKKTSSMWWDKELLKEWDKELLNKKYPFEFWKELKRPELKISEKRFGPMTYVGGYADLGPISHSRAEADYKSPAFGYVTLKPESITFETVEGSIHRMHLEVSMNKVRDLFVETGKEITFTRYALMGSWAFLLKKKTEYLTLVHEDASGILKHRVFDFHGKEETVRELMNLVSYLKRK